MTADRAQSPFSIKRELDLGQLLTALSIVITLIGGIFAWNNDKSLKEREYADRVRRSASVVTAKIERWAELSNRYFEDIQTTLVDVSEVVAKTNVTEGANRLLFRGMMDARAKSSQRIVDEQLQLAYMELYGYIPAFQEVFDGTISDMKTADHSTHKSLEALLQKILQNPAVFNSKKTRVIGNALRFAVEEARMKHSSQIQAISLPVRRKMLAVIQMSDNQLREAKTHPDVLALFPAKATASAAAK